MNAGDLVAVVADLRGDDFALLQPNGTELVTSSFRQLEDNARRIARYLNRLGLKRGDRVALVMRNQIELVEALLGVLKGGFLAIPLSIHSGMRRINLAIENCNPHVIIADSYGSLYDDIQGIANSHKIVVGSGGSSWIKYSTILAESAAQFDSVKVAPGDAAICLYTSGSTGKPKGVLISHRASVHATGVSGQLSKNRVLIPSQRALIAMPIAHEAAYSSLRQTLAFGGSVILLDKFLPKLFLQLLLKFSCTRTVLVPSMAISLVAEAQKSLNRDFPSLQLVAIGGAPTSKTLMENLQGVFRSAFVIQFYGMTESGNIFTRRRANGKLPPIDSLGVPALGVQVRLGDNDLANLGQLFVKAPTLMEQYLGEAEVGVDWFATGDVFSKDASGFYYFRGRMDDMFICGGENVYPLEIENILLSHPSVMAAAICPFDDFARGAVPVALVVNKGAAPITEAELLGFYDSVGPSFARPARILFVDHIPLTRIGKVDRQRVLETVAALVGRLDKRL